MALRDHAIVGYAETKVMEKSDRDVFVHIRAVESAGLHTLAEGDRVEFDLERGKDGRESAGSLKLA